MLFYLIKVIHFVFVSFMILTPFLTISETYLLLHAQLSLLLVMKWLIRSWECGFTILEYKLRGIKKEESFLYSVMNPLFRIEDKALNILSFFVTVILGSYSFNKYLEL